MIKNKNKLIFAFCSMLLSRGSYAASSSHEADPGRREQISTEKALSERSENRYTTLSGERVEVNPADYPRLDFNYEEKKIYLEEIVKGSNTIIKWLVLDYSHYIIGIPKNNYEPSELKFYLTLLEKKIISPEDMSNFDQDMLHCAYFPWSRSLSDLDSNRNSLLVEFFCKKAIQQIRYHLTSKPSIILPIIKECIDRVPAILSSIDIRIAKKLLEEDPDFVLENLNKLSYCKGYNQISSTYSVLSDSKTTVEEKINKLNRILFT